MKIEFVPSQEFEDGHPTAKFNENGARILCSDGDHKLLKGILADLVKVLFSSLIAKRNEESAPTSTPAVSVSYSISKTKR